MVPEPTLMLVLELAGFRFSPHDECLARKS